MPLKSAKSSKSSAKGGGRLTRAKSKRSCVRSKKAEPVKEITISNVVSKCCNKLATSPRKLTQHFLSAVVDEMNSIASKEKSQTKIGVINQISFDLTDMIAELDYPVRNQGNAGIPVDIKQALMELKRIDHAINELMVQKSLVYKNLELSKYLDYNLPRITTSWTESVDHVSEALPTESRNVTYNADLAQPGPSGLSRASTAVEPELIDYDNYNKCFSAEPGCSTGSFKYFDENVVNTAVISSHLCSTVKCEVDESFTDEQISASKFADSHPTVLKLVGETLFCGCQNGSLVKFSFKRSIMAHLPHRTSCFTFSDGSVSGLCLWHNNLIIATKTGLLKKFNLRGKVVKSLNLHEEITCIAEVHGLLHAGTTGGHLFVINLRNLTHTRNPIDLGAVPKSLKSTEYNNSFMLMCLSVHSELIGITVKDDGVLGSVVFKYSYPGLSIFDVGQRYRNGIIEKNSGLMLFCGNAQSASCLHMQNEQLIEEKVLHISSSTMLTCENFLFVGTYDGDVMILNTKNMKTYFYQRVIQEKVVGLAYLPPVVYIGGESSVYSLIIENVVQDDYN